MKTFGIALLASAVLVEAIPEAKIKLPIAKKQLAKSRLDRVVANTLNVPFRYENGERVLTGDVRGPSDGSLTDFSDELYTTPITVGNGQHFTIDLDTGSSDIWVRGPQCTSSDGSCGNPGNLTVNTGDSTLSDQGFTWSTTYGSGSVSGEVYSGPVEMGGLTATVDFGVSTSETGFDSPGDGLLGLGFASISNIATAGGKNTNFIDALNLSDNIFAFYLSDASNGDLGEISIGGVDSTKFSGSLSYVPLNAETYWQFDGTGATFSVNGASGSLTPTTTNMICDTGTTLMIIDQAAADSINTAIGASAYDSSLGAYPIPCTATNGPNVVLTIQNIQLTITPAQYVLNLGGQCISGISQGAASSGVAILGDTFLRAVYTVFDKANNRLGWAPAVHPTNATIAYA